MTFRIGQKVVRFGGLDRDGNAPPIGEPCTVVNIYATPDGAIQIELAEYPYPETESDYAGFKAKFFRPIVDRKTDISVFTQMLKPTDRKVDA